MKKLFHKVKKLVAKINIGVLSFLVFIVLIVAIILLILNILWLHWWESSTIIEIATFIIAGLGFYLFYYRTKMQETILVNQDKTLKIQNETLVNQDKTLKATQFKNAVEMLTNKVLAVALNGASILYSDYYNQPENSHYKKQVQDIFANYLKTKFYDGITEREKEHFLAVRDRIISDLREAYLHKADLQNANLQYAKLQEAYLQNAKLQEADLQNAKLQEADLQNAKLQEADLQNANLQKAKLQFAYLRKANLQNAKLRKAKLQFADLQKANLQFAYLQYADLQNANLRYADLQYTDLRRTVFFQHSNDNLIQEKVSSDTIEREKQNILFIKENILFIKEKLSKTSSHHNKTANKVIDDFPVFGGAKIHRLFGGEKIQDVFGGAKIHSANFAHAQVDDSLLLYVYLYMIVEHHKNTNISNNATMDQQIEQTNQLDGDQKTRLKKLLKEHDLT